MRRVASALFLLGVATVPLMHPLDVHIFGTTLIPADILFAASGAAWLASVVQRHARLRWGPFPFTVAAYVAVVSLSGARTGTTSALDHVVIGFSRHVKRMRSGFPIPHSASAARNRASAAASGTATVTRTSGASARRRSR